LLLSLEGDCCLELDLYEFYNRWEGVSPTAHHDFLPKYYGNLPLSQLLGFRHSVLILLIGPADLIKGTQA
jgi:hypothetical protein